MFFCCGSAADRIGRGRKRVMKQNTDDSRQKSVKALHIIVMLGLPALLTAIFLFQPGGFAAPSRAKKAFQEMEPQFRNAVLTDTLRERMGHPVTEAGHVVFLSVCDGKQRAHVYHGAGATLDKAWANAKRSLEAGLDEHPVVPRWLKADIVCSAQPIRLKKLAAQVDATRNNYYLYGLAFDRGFKTALIEQDMSGSRGYDYEGKGLNLKNINAYLKETHRPKISKLPKEFLRFQCYGWLYDEDGTVYPLTETGKKYGRREVKLVDKAYAEDIIRRSSAYLKDQCKPDGSFCYAVYPRINQTVNYYNIIRHAGAIWGICQSYRVTGDADYLSAAKRAIGYMQTKTVYSSPDTCYLYGAESDDFQLGGSALAILALTEYMDTAKSTEYVDLCKAFGKGILSMMNRKTGEFVHSLNTDFSLKEKFTIIYYDGEAIYALCRLYRLTGDKEWLEAAQRAMDRCIAKDYTKHCDDWIAYALNELTQFVNDRPDYYKFALKNVTVNMDEIEHLKTPAPTYQELMLASFETYDRMLEKGLDPGKFDSARFLRLIYGRADAQLNGYFYPEYAMYMAKPDRILYSFTSRWYDYRTRIDDVQHNINSYYAYWKNYDRLVARGMLQSAEKQ